MNRIEINKNACKGCGLCVAACPKKILELSKTESNDKGYFVAAVAEPSQCIACAFCAEMCPDCAITVFKDKA
ncbi:MAG: 4Fe-4S dicluster domain-containing protein [Christensenellales bacterium]|jgi:2-oxoglutarate ferredoxin oxidoreductase subunit delta|nr:4Fe-4S binding protein [Eubacteriales bacterium]